MRWTLCLALLVSSVACDSGERAPAGETREGPAGPAKLELIAAPKETRDVAAAVRAERDRARAQGRQLVVYVGATWCEPCKHFHEAAASGRLDDAFPRLTVLEFDHDVHEAGLTDAACRSEMIPLFAVPTEDGRCSDRRTAGAIKGPAAVDFIKPRLQAILN